MLITLISMYSRMFSKRQAPFLVGFKNYSILFSIIKNLNSLNTASKDIICFTFPAISNAVQNGDVLTLLKPV
jgi:hypothetical protein